MGYEDRDYMQTPRGGDLSSIMPGYPVCRFLIFATIGLFVLQVLLTRDPKPGDFQPMDRLSDSSETTEFDESLVPYYETVSEVSKISVVENLFALETDRVVRGEFWRLITYAFLHDRVGIWHILVNMFFLYRFGRELETMLGGREFLCFYFFSALFASLVFVALQLLIGERYPAIGASGAVLAVVCLYAIYHPNDTIHLFFLFDVPIRVLLVLYVLFDIHPILLKLGGSPVMTGTSHAAHLGGVLFGYLYYRFSWHFAPMLDRVTTFFPQPNPSKKGRPSPNAQVSPRSVKAARNSSRVEQLEANLDAVLQKISEHGEESLTAKERKFLDEASRHYQKKND